MGLNAHDIQGFDDTGRLWLRRALPPAALECLDGSEPGGRPGARLAVSQAVADVLAADGPLGQAIGQLRPDAFPVRVVSFDKTAGMNWTVPWHQDRIIAVADRVETAEVHNWSRKAGVWHCEPSSDVLQRMLFVHVHLDDQDAETGAMEIALGSHHRGTIPAANADTLANQYPHEICVARRGDILILHMLILHRSGVSCRQARRRVLRVDYANGGLPGGLRWQMQT